VTDCRGVVDRVSGGIGHSGGQEKTVGPAPLPEKERSRFPHFNDHHSYGFAPRCRELLAAQL
jgi:hypothetical protein